MAHNLGSGKHLFIDEMLVAEASGVQRVVNRPRLTGPVIEPGPPGSYNDAFVGACGRAVDDEGTYKMWVPGRSVGAVAGRGEKGQRSPLPLGYYTSTDGAAWDAPQLGLFEWGGSKDNNICCMDSGYVFKDPHPRGEDQSYKLLSHAGQMVRAGRAGEPSGSPTGGLYFYTSPDGIHWTFQPRRVLALHPDCFNQVLYDERIGRYVAYIRCWPKPIKYGYGRAVARLELDDPLEPWPTPQIDEPRHFWGPKRVAAVTTQFPIVMSYPDYDAPGHFTDIYDPHVVPYPWAEGVYFAFPELNHHKPDSPRKNHSTLEIGLCVSRDGVDWQWPSLQAYVPFGPEGSGRTGMLYNITGLIRRGDEIVQYHFGTDVEHGERPGEVYSREQMLNSGRIYRTVQRLDGFVSMDFVPDGGDLLTEPVRFDGDRLVLNVDAAAGDGTVALCDEQAKPVAGYEAERCDPIRADAVEHVVTWGGRPSVGELRGQAVRVRFQMRGAKLYAVQFC